MSYCETQSLAIGYGAPLLRDISLQAECGRILALIGPNGAGKSTLIKTLAGQLAAQSGAVLLDGKTLTTYTPNARARKLALMLSHTARTELTWPNRAYCRSGCGPGPSLPACGHRPSVPRSRGHRRSRG